MALITDIQKLEPGDEIRLFEIDGSEYGADILRFHGHAIPHAPEELDPNGPTLSLDFAGNQYGIDDQQGPSLTLDFAGNYYSADNGLELAAKSIWWQGNEYAAWPVNIEGIGADSDGTASRPTFVAGNVNGRVTALCLAFEDLLKFKLTVRETMAKYLDANNFFGGNPDADPTQEALEIWFIDQKTGEDGEQVQWELSSPGEIDNHGLPGRQMTTFCHWAMTGGYRGPNCGYTGRLMFDDEDNPTDDPSKDICKGGLSSCKLRLGENEELSHGGYPAVSLIARS